MNDPEGNGVVVDPESKLEEELGSCALPQRPSFGVLTAIGYRATETFPSLINQWLMSLGATYPGTFPRTAEFLWQEGHTAHATREEAVEETERMLHVYGDFAEQTLAIPVVRGVKTERERFAGALDTYCIEAPCRMERRHKQALVTLGQNFAKAFDVKFADKDNKEEYVWATSGVFIIDGSTDRTHLRQWLGASSGIGPLFMVIVPIYRKDEERDAVLGKCQQISQELKAAGIRVKVDDDAMSSVQAGSFPPSGNSKGVPVRLALGPRDLQNNKIELARRDLQTKEVVDQPEDHSDDMEASTR